MWRKSLGKAGEEEAIQYLRSKKYKILEKNYTLKVGEIDIIASRDKKLCFCEVKTRTSTEFGGPFESITPSKMKRMTRAAKVYMMNCSVAYEVYQFDVIGIMMTHETTIQHIENAFEAPF